MDRIKFDRLPHRVIEWDWKEQLPTNELREALTALTGGAVMLHEIRTESDQYAIVLATAEMTPEQAYRAWLNAPNEED